MFISFFTGKVILFYGISLIMKEKSNASALKSNASALAKTAILLTEYAGKRRSEGMTLAQAAYSAAKVRLRPILMTVLSMVFGLIPLMMAHGVGANGSRSLATGVIGGMTVGTLALLFLVPSLFIAFQFIQERVKRK